MLYSTVKTNNNVFIPDVYLCFSHFGTLRDGADVHILEYVFGNYVHHFFGYIFISDMAGSSDMYTFNFSR